jgi:hypothetical protein
MKTIRFKREKITVTLGVVILAVIGGGVVCREWTKRVEMERMNACINNLRLVDSAKVQWAWERGMAADATPTWTDIQPFMGCGDISPPRCPDGGDYTYGRVTDMPRCSIPGHDLQ